MTINPRLDIIGAALADISRTRILCELMDGRAYTNKELSCAAHITPQTTTVHLQRLEEAGLTISVRSGRHVYHRIASTKVAETLETLSHLSPTDHLSRLRSNSRQNQSEFLARSCYNHIAGRLGVLMCTRMLDSSVLSLNFGTLTFGSEGKTFCKSLDLAFVPLETARKPQVKACLDWSERQMHVSGPFGTALMSHMLDELWIERVPGNRALRITAKGTELFGSIFQITRSEIEQVALSTA